MRHKIFTVLFVQVNDNLGVAAGAKTMAPRLEILGDVLESVKFAIQDNPDRAILIRERLTAIREIHDRQPRVDQQNRSRAAEIVPPLIGPTMADRRNHGHDTRLVYPSLWIEDKLACNSAHG